MLEVQLKKRPTERDRIKRQRNSLVGCSLHPLVNARDCALPAHTTNPHTRARLYWEVSTWTAASVCGARPGSSYETCGNVNEYTDSKRTDYLDGKTLRVSFPGNSGSGYTITTVPEGATASAVGRASQLHTA